MGEQDGFLYKMDYQTARHAAENARWYAASGDASYLEKAYRSLNWVTYTSDANGRATESPYSLNIATWWSDTYGECPRMFYHAFAGVPEWAPPQQDHILYSYGILRDVIYGTGAVGYTAHDAVGTEYLRLSYLPTEVTLNGSPLPLRTDLTADGWMVRDLGGGDYAVTVHHTSSGAVRLATDTGNLPPTVSLTAPANGASYVSPALITLAADATGNAGAITNVEFFNGATKLGDDQTSPYTFVWSNVPAGSYALTAKATDDHGLSKTSAPVNITVNAPAPVVVIGNTSEGSTTDFITDASGAWINANRFRAQADGTVTMMRAKVGAIAGHYQLAIYSDNNGSPSRLLRATASVTPNTTGWHTFPLTAPLALTNGSYYWLAIWSDDVNARIYADTGGSLRFGLYPYGAWPDPVSLTGSGTFIYSIYAANNDPTASFTGTPTTGATPLAVTFADTSTGTITNRSWDFGDGATTSTDRRQRKPHLQQPRRLFRQPDGQRAGGDEYAGAARLYRRHSGAAGRDGGGDRCECVGNAGESGGVHHHAYRRHDRRADRQLHRRRHGRGRNRLHRFERVGDHSGRRRFRGCGGCAAQ